MTNSGLINTRLQRSGRSLRAPLNRFSGWPLGYHGRHDCKTAEAVRILDVRSPTPLKRGVNEILCRAGSLSCTQAASALLRLISK